MTWLWWSLLWASAGALVWAYLLYPLVLLFVGLRKRPLFPPPADLPGVSVILAAYNEGKILRRKLENTLAFDYPADRLEIIAVSDGSTDETDAILREHESRGVRTLIAGVRIGKTEAQNRGVAIARHPFVFFTDATTIHPPDILRRLVARFGDPGVGCVTGRPVFREEASLTSRGQRFKQAYDAWVRTLLSRADTVYGATGCVYAVRRDLYVPLRPDLDSDFVESLTLLSMGYRTVYEPQAVAIVDRRVPDPRQELARRSRIAVRSFRGMIYMRRLLDPRRDFFRAVSLATQRPLKWLAPLYLMGILTASLALSTVPAIRVLLLLQALFYGSALLAYALESRGIRLPTLFALPLFFCITCLASLAGLRELLRGEVRQTWEPVCR
jgi:cellulose synthase/poly-beta-1,6-N-acetylglucosamine synthase-like glycosyltransferase